MNRLPRKLARALAAEGLGERAVLDACCRDGAHLARFGPGSVGLDRDPGAVERGRARGLDVRVADLDRPGWSRGLPPLDAAWLCDALVHLREPAAFLAELAGLLRPGAPVLAVEWVVPARGPARALALAFPGARAHRAHPEHLHAFTDGSLRGLLEGAGLRVERGRLHALPTGVEALPGVRALLLPWWPPRTLVARVGAPGTTAGPVNGPAE